MNGVLKANYLVWKNIFRGGARFFGFAKIRAAARAIFRLSLRSSKKYARRNLT